MKSNRTICIIGAGIGGTTAALELARFGFTVILIDKAKRVMSRTSGINPGRSALGFHYTDFETCCQMYERSSHFDSYFPDMRREDPGARYFVVKDSQISKEEYLTVCNRLQTKYPALFYRILKENEYESIVNKNEVVLGIQTEEKLINVPKLVSTVAQRIEDSKNITLLTGSEVVDARQKGDTFELTYRDESGKHTKIEVDNVVNASWEYRHKIDSFLGITPPYFFTNRLKVLAKVALPKELQDAHSMMFVRGPFAMMANTRDGTAFLTYAEVTNYSQTSSIEVPKKWEKMICSHHLTKEKQILGEKIIQGAQHYIPQLRDAALLEVRAGIIYSEGDADPFDPSSTMHSRAKTGLYEIVPGWLSLDTGKLIFGPYYATQVLKRLYK